MPRGDAILHVAQYFPHTFFAKGFVDVIDGFDPVCLSSAMTSTILIALVMLQYPASQLLCFGRKVYRRLKNEDCEMVPRKAYDWHKLLLTKRSGVFYVKSAKAQAYRDRLPNPALPAERWSDEQYRAGRCGWAVAPRACGGSRRWRQRCDQALHRLVDPKKVGLPIHIFVSVSLHSQERRAAEKFEEKIQSFSEVIECVSDDRARALRVAGPKCSNVFSRTNETAERGGQHPLQYCAEAGGLQNRTAIG